MFGAEQAPAAKRYQQHEHQQYQHAAPSMAMATQDQLRQQGAVNGHRFANAVGQQQNAAMVGDPYMLATGMAGPPGGGPPGMRLVDPNRAVLPAPDALTLEHLSTSDLKLLLHNRGQSTYGDRAALVKRLGEAMRKELRSERIWVAGRGQSLRRGAAVVVYQGSIYQFGGLDPSNNDHNTIHKWSPGSPGFDELKTKGRLPPARWTSAAVVHMDYMYVFGGFYGYAGLAKPNGRRNDLWRYDFVSGWWSQIGAQGDTPCPRSHHSMSLDRERVVLFGGVDEKERTIGGYSMFDAETKTEYENVHLNDVYILDMFSLAWTQLIIEGEGPFGGLKATSVVWNGYLYVMGWKQEGGVVTDMPGQPSATTYTFEMWRLQLPAPGPVSPDNVYMWEHVNVRGTAPTPRDNYSQCKIENAWFIHGGNDVFGELKSDTYEFDFTSGTWSLVKAKGMASLVPDARYSHRAVAMGGNMYVVGGINKFSAPKRNHGEDLMQRCAAVEMLILNRPVPPATDHQTLDPAKVELLASGNMAGANMPSAKKLWGVSKLAHITNKLLNGPAASYQASAKPSTGMTSAVSDVTLLCGGMRVHAHKSVLSTQSTKFAKLLSMSPKEVAMADVPLAHLKKYTILLPILLFLEVLYLALVQAVFSIMQFVPRGGGRVLRVRDVPYDVLLVLLQYMYNCLEEIDEEMLMDMFKASQVYGIQALHNDCLRHLQDMMDVKTVVRFAHLAEECRDSVLYTACVHFCSNHWSDVVHSAAYIHLLKAFPHGAKKLASDVQSVMAGRQAQMRHGAQPSSY